ncbi:MAG: hypothetical protein HEQ29_16415 [Dolichospermum sp. LBC05a]|nr:hypothetical protein [Dolichospermum sp. OL01]MCO5798271.1 hypothetical protein [Dolichospermum sp. OL03]MCS6282765.1 hypothetical protein [Dolichospermum sp.]QSV59729.1 MAG: hypothetical protein HEQ29_16415 [Dolichospermum sp. LBC05a]
MSYSIHELREHLNTQVISLNMRWNMYNHLFNETEEKILILQETAPHMFGVIQIALFNDIILYLTRLTDPKKNGKHENLVLEQLLEHSDITTKPELLEELKIQRNALREKCQNCRTSRDKSIAHQDLTHALTPLSPYSGISLEDIKELRDMVNKLMNTINRNLENEETLYELHHELNIDVDSLFESLEKAKQNIK